MKGKFKNKYRYLQINTFFLVRRVGPVLLPICLKWTVESLLFMGAGAGVGAGEIKLVAGEKWTGSATLPRVQCFKFIFTFIDCSTVKSCLTQEQGFPVMLTKKMQPEQGGSGQQKKS